MKSTPIIINTQKSDWRQSYRNIVDLHPEIIINDYYLSQISELFHIKFPHLSGDKVKQKEFTHEYLSNTPVLDHGNWVYLPWHNQLIHLLVEEDFYKVITARNFPLISHQEQKKFHNLHVGIIGLSVGSSIAINLVHSGGGQNIKLADSDQLDLSNLNRIQASVTNLGKNKAIIAAENIYSINPYSNIELFKHKINSSNLKEFLTQPQLDLVIDECDDLALKKFLRLSCQSLKIPLLSVTDDGFQSKVDIYRFDINANIKELKHIPVKNFNQILKEFKAYKQSKTNIKQQLKDIAQLIGVENISIEMQKGAMLRAENKIAGWPQLAMTTFLGGGLASFVALQIANKYNSHEDSQSFSIPSLLNPNYHGKKADQTKASHTKKFTDFINAI
jgi:tRNA A37 threonylcarbamoyladenosine dehydratase